MSDNLEREVKDLSPDEKRALLARLLKEKASQTRIEYLPAYGQRALWFIHQLAPQSAAYHVASTSRVRSLIDIDAFKRALQHLVDRHATLRTTYEQRDDQLIQVIHAHQDVHFEQIDASAWDEDELYTQVVEAHKQTFDLAKGPVIRWQLFTKSSTDHVFLITVHHIAFDGYSMFVLLYDLKLAYDAEVAGQKLSLPPLKAQYTDYVDQQMSLLSSEKGDSLKAYWLNQLSGELPIINLPADFPRPLVQTYEGASIEFVIDTQRTARLKEFAMAEGLTLYVLLLSIFQTQLHRYSGQNDLLIGSPNSNRDLTEFGGTVGYFVDPVVLRSTIETDTTFKTLLGKTRKTVIDALAHQGYPFMLLVEQLVTLNDPSRSPLFQVVFNLQSLQRIETTSPLFQKDHANSKALLLEPFVMPHEEGQFDLMLDVVEVGGTLWCAFKYNTDLYEKTTIARMAKHYETLLEAVLANPEAKLANLPLLTEDDRRQLLVEWNNSEAEYPHDQLIHQLFEQQTEKTPNAVAVALGDQQITYHALNQRANQLARHLRSLGVKNESLVGINMEASIDMIVALLSILKAGGAYVPLDPAYPSERLAFMIDDSQIAIVLTHTLVADQITKSNLRLIHLDSDWETIAQENVDNLPNVTQPDTLAYVIYTSGSTGQPKGVMIEHQSLVNYIWWAAKVYLKGRVLDFPLFSSLSFDLTVTSVFTPLITGGQIVVYPEDNNSRGTSILKVIKDGLVDVVKLTPAHLSVIRDMDFSQTRIKVFIVGGEDFKTDLALAISTAFNHNIDIYNEYGPTEATVGCMIHRFDPTNDTGLSVSIGVPADNARIYVLDDYLNLMPIGVIGEMYIAGDGLARGYLNRHDLTAERFVTHPFQDGKRLYKTGDIARWNANGRLEYLGRADHQVKIRGFRIELGEIEEALKRIPSVNDAIVIVREDKPTDKRLAAYIVMKESQTAETHEFRTYLRDNLPDYMIPSDFVILDAFPLTPNRKVDRKALPMPQRQITPQIEMQNVPTKPMELLIADIWREVLKVDTIGIYDNFFDLGGHSLQVMQVVTRLETQTGLKIDPVTMRMQTLGQLAMSCELLATNPPAPASPAENTRQQGLFKSIKRFVTGNQDKV